MKKLIALMLFVIALPTISSAIGAPIVAALAANSANTSHVRHKREAQEQSSESFKADGVVICRSRGEWCEIQMPSPSGGCSNNENISFQQYLQREKGAGYSMVGIAYNNYDHEMKIYYRLD